jgi:DNA helicase-2/ATP-dependent DNA helicase PcrA
VLEGKKLNEFGDWIGVRMSGHQVNMEEGGSFGYEVGDRILFMENLARVKGISLREQYDIDYDDLPWSLVERVARGLVEWKRAKHMADFTDMLQLFVDSDWTARLEVLFVDEAQDLSLLQWKVVQKLARGARRVVIAGDDDQAIYRWAGAAVDYFVNLPGRVRVLEQSWRVPEAVQAPALEMVGRVQGRRPKQWHARRGAVGAVQRVQSLDEIDFHAGEETLVLSRNACFLKDDAIPLLQSEGVIYEFRGHPSVKQSLVDAILDWEKLRKGEQITVEQALKIYEYMGTRTAVAHGYKKLPGYEDKAQLVSLNELQERGGLLTDAVWHDALTNLTGEQRMYMTRALRRGEKLTRRPTVRLSTIHGSKGGEATHVVLYRDMAQRTFREMDKYPEDEARVFYVAATRAKERLTIVAPQTRRAYDI